MKNKEIRFIDSHYNELFRIPDGGQITIHYPDGHSENRVCRYIDDYHTYVDDVCFHICQFAEIMEQNNQTYTPAEPKQMPKYKDILFVIENHSELDHDKFFKTDNGLMEVYYNPDANSGGQIVELYVTFDDVKKIAKEYKKPDHFFSHLGAISKCYLYDVGDADFRGKAEWFISAKADFEGCSEKTMRDIKKYAGVVKSKPPREEER